LGSYVVVDTSPPLAEGGGFTIEVWVWPSAHRGRRQAIAGRFDGRHGFALGLDDLGCASLWLGGQDGVNTATTGTPLRTRAWHRLTASYTPDGGLARVAQEPLEPWPNTAGAASIEMSARSWLEASSPFMLAAWGIPQDAHFNGKIESPRLLDGDGRTLAAWDLGSDFAGDLVAENAGGCHGRCVNLPMRAVTGHGWRGAVTDPALKIDEYGAAWFHEDDLEDAGWEPSLSFQVPETLSSGVYAVRVACDDGADELPFFVRPDPHGSHADVAVLMPTLSYLAYSNEHNSWAAPVPSTPRLGEILDTVGPRDRFAEEFGLKSIYELHPDGSGVAYVSYLRPMMNMRSDYGMPLLLGGPHQFSADLELLRWLDRMSVRYDVLTDHDLHADTQLLESYRVVLTGSHPEYWTGAMLDGLGEWLAEGGRLMYLGGNGFYWVTSLFETRPHVLEVRRGRAGTGVWRSEPGEEHHASTGEPGGLWRYRGRPPQRLVGVGFTAQGFDESRPYTRQSGGDDPRASWIFDGVEAKEFGSYGSVLSGAAGFEIDRADTTAGTPPHALVLATAGGFSDAYQAASEDILTSDSQQGGTVSPHVRADLVFFEGPNDGAVFSTGSIAWCGALLEDDCQNDISRITENVLRRFARSGPIS
jgi:N,N-dimethylformamidase